MEGSRCGASHCVSPGLAVFADGSTNPVPQYALMHGDTWGTSVPGASAVAAIQWVMLETHPFRNDAVLGLLSSTHELVVQTWDGSAWTVAWSTVVDGGATRPFDVVYERLSGSAMVVYGDSSGQLKFRRRASDTWDAEGNAGNVLPGSITWVAARASDRDVFVVAISTTPGVHVLRWNATAGAWMDQATVSSAPADTVRECAALAVESATDRALVVWGDTSKRLRYSEFTTAWSASATAWTSPKSMVWLVAQADPVPTHRTIAVAAQTLEQRYVFGTRTDEQWNDPVIRVGAQESPWRGVDVAFSGTSGEAVFAYAIDGSPGGVQYRTWSATSGFGGESLVASSSASINAVRLRGDAHANRVMLTWSDTNNSLFYRLWRQGGWQPPVPSVAGNLPGASRSSPFSFSF